MFFAYQCFSRNCASLLPLPSIIENNQELTFAKGNKERIEIIIASRVLDKFPLINAKKHTEARPRTNIHMYVHIYMMHIYARIYVSLLHIKYKRSSAPVHTCVIYAYTHTRIYS